jgi:esterase/lipase superfamily enzyme
MAISRANHILVAWAVLAGLGGCSSVSPSKVTGAARVSVYYATTRTFSATRAPDGAFLNEATADEQFRFGVANVDIPLPHSEGAPDGVTIHSYDPPLIQANLTRGAFGRLVRARLQSSRRPLIVFVHGFNNSFASAAHRAAVFAHDLQPDVAARPVIFSWPSKGKLFAYSSDEDSALLNQDRAREFLNLIRNPMSVSPIVLIGHSMGARVLTYALRDLALIRNGHWPPTRTPMFAHLILLEPDVNSDYFNENLVRVRALCSHVTIYASSHDRALRVSELLHGFRREGEFSTAELAKDIDVIDASAAKTDFIGHAYDGPQLFDDIRQLLHGLTLEQRLGQTLTKNPVSGTYALVK